MVTRRMQNIPGREYSSRELEVAEAAASAYDFECRRQRNRLRMGDSVLPVRRKVSLGSTFRERSDNGPGVDNIEERPRTDGEGKKAMLWIKLARFLIGRLLDPEAFIRSQFVLLGPADMPPSVEFLLSAAAEKNHQKAAEQLPGELKTAIRLNNDVFMQQVSDMINSPLGLTSEQAWARVLEDEAAEMSALFRYCMAYSIAVDPKTKDKNRFKELAVMFRPDAISQFNFSAEAYRQVWGSFIPASMGRKASGT